LRADQDDHAVTAVLVISPRDLGPAEGFPHGIVKASANSYLNRVGPAPVPETLDVDSNNSPVDGPVRSFHVPSRKQNRGSTLAKLERLPPSFPHNQTTCSKRTCS
jgi:hypothetical protein